MEELKNKGLGGSVVALCGDAAAAALAIVSDGEAMWRVASSLDELAEASAQEPSAVVVMDSSICEGLPERALARILRSNAQAAVVVLLGEASQAAALACLRAGAFECVMLSGSDEEEAEALRQAVARVRARAEARMHRTAPAQPTESAPSGGAGNGEKGGARFRTLLHLAQLSGHYLSDEVLLRSVLNAMARHMPIRGVAVSDVSARRIAAAYFCSSHDGAGHEGAAETDLSGAFPLGGVDAEAPSAANDSGDAPTGELAPEDLEGAGARIRFVQTDDNTALAGYDSLLAAAEPEILIRSWLGQSASLDSESLEILVYPYSFWTSSECTVALMLDTTAARDGADNEFLEMCAYCVAFDWEQSKLMLQVAHQASLGNIAIELTRNFVQPLTAIRTAAEFLTETLEGPDAAEGMAIVRENVERLRLQIQEFRRLSMLREDAVETVQLDVFVAQALDVLSVAIQSRGVTVSRDFLADCECVLLNGAALARTFLDLILAALRAVDIGGNLELRLRKADADHLAFELSHDGRQSARLVGPGASALPLVPGAERRHPTLQLAERTVHGCGGTLSLEQESGRRGVLRIVLPRNALRLMRRREPAP